MPYILSAKTQKLLVKIYNESMSIKHYLFEPSESEKLLLPELLACLYIKERYVPIDGNWLGGQPTEKYTITGKGIQEARRLIDIRQNKRKENTKYIITTAIAILSILISIYSIYTVKTTTSINTCLCEEAGQTIQPEIKPLPKQ